MDESQSRIEILEDELKRLQSLPEALENFPRTTHNASPSILHPPQPSTPNTEGEQSPHALIDISTVALQGYLLGSDIPVQPLQQSVASVADAASMLPTKSRALELVQEYMAHFKQSHHILDLEELEADIERIYAKDGLIAPEAAISRFRCLGTVACALQELSDTREKEQFKHCRRLCLKELPFMLAKEDIVSHTLSEHTILIRKGTGWHRSAIHTRLL